MKNEQTSSQGKLSASWRRQEKGREVQKPESQATHEAAAFRIAGYVRLSPTGDEREEGSLVSHPQRIKEFVDYKNMQSGGSWGSIIDWYIDKDLSGKDLNRPSFKRLCKDIEDGKIDMVVVTELSRLSRRVKDFCHVWDFFKEHDIKFISLKENFDTSTPMGELMLIQAISFAQFERETIVDRIKKGARARAQRGLASGSVALGYDAVPNKPNHREVNKDEAAYVEMIFRKFLELKKMAKLLDYLNENGYRTKEWIAKDGRKLGGSRWTYGSLYALLTNRVYIAQREVNKRNRGKDPSKLKEDDRYYFTDAQWAPVIDEKVFLDVQDLMSANRKKARKCVHTYLLTGFLVCAECGAELVGKSGNGKGGKYFYYGHKRKMLKEGDRHLKRCQLENIPATDIEEAVLQRLKVVAHDKELLAKLVRESHTDESKRLEHLRSLLMSKENERRKVSNQLDNLIETISECDDKVTRQILQKKVGEFEEKRLGVEGEILLVKEDLKNLSDRLVDAKSAFELLRMFRQGFERQPLSVQADTLSGIVRKITVEDGRILMEVYGAELEAPGPKNETPDRDQPDGGSYRNKNGRGDKTRTCNLMLPKHARYQLRYTPDSYLSDR